jgi:hypothetical protein
MRTASWRLVRNLVLLGTALANVPHGHAQTEVLTRSYDNNRTGANLNESSRVRPQTTFQDRVEPGRPARRGATPIRAGSRHEGRQEARRALPLSLWATRPTPSTSTRRRTSGRLRSVVPSGRTRTMRSTSIISTLPSEFSAHPSSIAM